MMTHPRRLDGEMLSKGDLDNQKRVLPRWKNWFVNVLTKSKEEGVAFHGAKIA